MIYRSVSKHLRGGHSVRCLSELPAARDFSLSFLILKKHLLRGNLHKKWIWLEHGLLSNCFYQNLKFSQNLNNQSVEIKQTEIFCQYILPLLSTLPGDLLSGQYIFYLGESYPGKYASIDHQRNCLPLKLINPAHFKTYWFSSFLIPLLYVWPIEKSYNICSC